MSGSVVVGEYPSPLVADQHCMAVPATTGSSDFRIRRGRGGVCRNFHIDVSLCDGRIGASAGCVLFWFSHSPESNAVVTSATVDVVVQMRT